MRLAVVNVWFALALISGVTGLASAQTPSRSVGRTDRGRLIDGVALDESEGWTLGGRRARYGTAELVALLGGAVDVVRRAQPRSPRLTIGDLSRRRGGHLPPHLSHRSGRDVDVGFYYLGEDGEPLAAPAFIRVGRSGRCERRGGAPCQLDVSRTWDLITAMLPASTGVQYVLIAPHIRELLLAEAERRGASMELILRFRLVTAPMSQSREHRDHFHVRVYCATDDRPRCVDESPLHAWYVFGAGMDPTFVARARERAGSRRRQEIASEARDRERRAQARARVAAAATWRHEFRATRAARRARARARLAAQEEATRERRAARTRRLARTAATRAQEAAHAAARREHHRDERRRRIEARAAVRAMSPAQRRAHLQERAAAARAAEQARHQALIDTMARARAERIAGSERRRAERRRSARERAAREQAEAEARREAYRAHVARRSAEHASARAERRQRD